AWNRNVKRITHVDERLDSQGHRWIHMPGWMVARVLAGGRRGAATQLIIGLLFIREQQLRGASHVVPQAACADLGISRYQYDQAVRKLTTAGVIEQDGEEFDLPVYVIPGLGHAPVRRDYLDATKTDAQTTFRKSRPRFPAVSPSLSPSLALDPLTQY